MGHPARMPMKSPSVIPRALCCCASARAVGSCLVRLDGKFGSFFHAKTCRMLNMGAFPVERRHFRADMRPFLPLWWFIPICFPDAAKVVRSTKPVAKGRQRYTCDMFLQVANSDCSWPKYALGVYSSLYMFFLFSASGIVGYSDIAVVHGNHFLCLSLTFALLGLQRPLRFLVLLQPLATVNHARAIAVRWSECRTPGLSWAKAGEQSC